MIARLLSHPFEFNHVRHLGLASTLISNDLEFANWFTLTWNAAA